MKSSVSVKPRQRKTRSKVRKPKYLSLRLQLSDKTSQSRKPKSESGRTGRKNAMGRDQQLKLFPVPNDCLEHDCEDRDGDEHDDVAFLFNLSEGGATLNGLLGSGGTTTTAMSSEEDSFSPPASIVSYARFDSVDHARSLVRKAMRRKGGDVRGERWVRFSEVVKKQEQSTEEASSANSVASATVKKEEEQHSYFRHGCQFNYSGGFENKNPAKGCGKTAAAGSLSLKLDYQEILDAWSDKGPWYLDGESPQTVPEVQDEIISNRPPSSIPIPCCGSGNLFRVPESFPVDVPESISEKGGSECPKMTSNPEQRRAESVLRYKEKRQSRLFSKRIRYEVRKINAEKRPRMKVSSSSSSSSYTVSSTSNLDSESHVLHLKGAICEEVKKHFGSCIHGVGRGKNYPSPDPMGAWD